MDDPITFFGESLTQMHSHARDELEELQRQAMSIRFQQHVRGIEMVRKLADRLGITELREFNDVVPLMFSHTAFKSYPAALIDNKLVWSATLVIVVTTRLMLAARSLMTDSFDLMESVEPASERIVRPIAASSCCPALALAAVWPATPLTSLIVWSSSCPVAEIPARVRP